MEKKTCTVKELIDALSEFDETMIVVHLGHDESAANICADNLEVLNFHGKWAEVTGISGDVVCLN
jgi:hypothetical protein|tara:strand:- start:659 stop:853 length:195 start_codon:yes stop_codon:yes gene_type:complete